MRPGDIVIGMFPGARVAKSRPAVVLSTGEYHKHRPDVIVGVITTRPPDPLCPTDCAIQNWRAAGLHAPSYFRLYLTTLLQRDVRVIGRLAEDDWNAVKIRAAIGFVGEN
jgi:hypothetical protein